MIASRTRSRVDMTVYGDPVVGLPALAEQFSGADLSLTSTGIASIVYGRCRRGLLADPAKPDKGTPLALRGVERLDWLEQRLDESIGSVPELVAVEGYSFGSKANHHSIGEWGGVAKLLLRRRGMELVAFSPKTIKRFITGDGNAEKSAVSLALFKRWGIEEPQNDKADAVALAIMALCLARPGMVELTKYQTESLGKAEKI